MNYEDKLLPVIIATASIGGAGCGTLFDGVWTLTENFALALGVTIVSLTGSIPSRERPR